MRLIQPKGHFLFALATAALFVSSGGVKSIADIRRVVRMNLAHGVDWIKVNATERAGTPDTDPRKQMWNEAEVRAIVEEGHGTYLTDEALDMMKLKGIALVPTYSTVIDLAEPGGDYDQPALIAENPLEDVRTLQDPLLIISNGRVVLDRLNFGKK